MKQTLIVLMATAILLSLPGCSNPLASDVSSAVQAAEQTGSGSFAEADDIEDIDADSDTDYFEGPVQSEDTEQVDEPTPADPEEPVASEFESSDPEGETETEGEATGRDRARQNAPDHAAVHRL